MRSFYIKWVLPRLFFIPYYLHWIVLQIVSFVTFRKTYTSNLKAEPKLLISAGVKGWESIEFKELLRSASEYLGERNKVIQHKLKDNKHYISDIKKLISEHAITHFFYDPRTGDQTVIGGFFESVYLSILLTRNNITPIVFFTDMSYRRWRMKGALVSAISGIAICFVTPRLAWPILPHNRIYGPSLMPFSVETLNWVQHNNHNNFDDSLVTDKTAAYFIGSLYEPRTTILNYIKKGLNERGFDLMIMGRQLGAARKPDSVYWKTMIDAPIIFTTSDQLLSPDFDWTWIPNLVYRYLEAISCGALLIAPIVPCIERYFEPGVHFIPFYSEEDAIDKIEYYLVHSEERKKIATEGTRKARALIESKIFWLHIDACLSIKALL